jgi:hypothetical protein
MMGPGTAYMIRVSTGGSSERSGRRKMMSDNWIKVDTGCDGPAEDDRIGVEGMLKRAHEAALRKAKLEVLTELERKIEDRVRERQSSTVRNREAKAILSLIRDMKEARS